jgi:hypothetical protein
MQNAPAPLEDPSDSFKMTLEDNSIRIVWRNSATLYIVGGLLATIFLILLVNGHRIPSPFIYSAVAIVVLLFLTTRHNLLITPTFIKYRGGLLTMFGVTIMNHDIKVIAYQYKMPYENDSDPEYALYLVLSNGQRVKISNRLSKAEIEWLQYQVAVYNQDKIVSRYEFPDAFIRFTDMYEFPLSLLLAVIIGAAAWLGPTEADIVVTEPTLMLLGWITYLLGVVFSLYRTKLAKAPITVSSKLIFTLLSAILYGALFYWKFL